MTIAELIVALQQFPSEADVLAEGYDQYCLPVVGVERVQNDRLAGIVIRTREAGFPVTAPAEELY